MEDTLHWKGLVLASMVLSASLVCADPAKEQIVFSQLVYTIRDPQTNTKDFRDCLEKIGEYLALDVAKELNTKEISVQTLTGATAFHSVLDEQPVLVTILRAGIPLCLGVQRIFPNAEVGFLGMSRDEKTLQARVDYIALPDMKDKCVVIVDTMIATGGSILDAIKIIEKCAPRKIVVVGAIASSAGIARIQSYDSQIKIYAAAIDPLLNNKGYIVPGLGDAGDRSYGIKAVQKANGA